MFDMLNMPSFPWPTGQYVFLLAMNQFVRSDVAMTSLVYSVPNYKPVQWPSVPMSTPAVFFELLYSSPVQQTILGPWEVPKGPAA